MTLVPYAIIAVGWQLVYRGLGYGGWGSQALADPGADPVQFLTSVALFNPFLLFAQLAGVGADIYMFLPPLGIALGWGIAILFLACLAFVMKPELQLDPRARFFALGMVLSIIPSCTIFPADRLLLPSSVGAAGLLALFFARVNTEKEMPKHVPSRRRIERLFYYGLIFVHLVMAPLSLPVKIYIQAQIFQLIEAPIQDDSQTVLEGKTVITLDDVTMIGTTRLHDRRVWDGADIPAQTYAIAPMSLGPMPIRYTRLDETTLSVEFLKPYSWIFWRDLRHPFAPGDQVKLERLRVEIVRVDSRGVPTEITLSFDVPLEDPAYVWLEYKDLVPWPFSPPHFVPITPPPIGESITLNE